MYAVPSSPQHAEGTFHGDGAEIASGAYTGLSVYSSGSPAEATTAQVSAVETASPSSMNGNAYGVLPNTCINCPVNTYQPIKGQAATFSSLAGACRCGLTRLGGHAGGERGGTGERLSVCEGAVHSGRCHRVCVCVGGGLPRCSTSRPATLPRQQHPHVVGDALLHCAP